MHLADADVEEVDPVLEWSTSSPADGIRRTTCPVARMAANAWSMPRRELCSERG